MNRLVSVLRFCRAGVIPDVEISRILTPERNPVIYLFTAFRDQPKITVQYFDTETALMKQTEMYMDGYKTKLVKDDTSYKGLWNVSFVLKEM